jgi:hypothetical protein
MAADVLMSNVTADCVGEGVSLRVVGTQIPPAKMSVQMAISGTARVQLQGRIHKDAPWVEIDEPRTQSCLFYVDPVWSLRAISTGMGASSSVSVWAAWNV